jgi:cation transport ATPase
MQEKDSLQFEDDVQDIKTSQRQQRIERREARRAEREAGGFSWMIGLILIIIGGLYLLQQTGILPGFTNWWALFMLLPAAGVFSAAVSAYRRSGGQFTPEVIGLLMGSLLFLAITAFFLFGVSFTWFVPLFLIAAGLFILFGPIVARR